MGISIQNAFVQTFENNVIHLAQQEQAKLRGFTMERGPNSKNHNWERIGTNEMTEKTTSRVSTPEANTAWTRRTGVMRTWHNGDTVEKEDIQRMLVEPKSALTKSFSAGMNRKFDDIIIDAADGTTNTLDGAGGTVAFPAGQKLGDGTGVISFDFVAQVQELFMQNDIGPEVPKVFVVGPTQVRKLMALTEQTSKDYVSRGLDQLSATGIVPNWMGFTWILSNRLNVPGAGEINCLAFTKEGIGLHVSEEPNFEVGKDPSKSFMWRVYGRFMATACRVNDEHIVKCHLKDAMS